MIINITNGELHQIEFESISAMPGYRINEDITVTGAPTGLALVEYSWYDARIVVDDPLETVSVTVLGVTDTSNATVSYNNTVIGTIDYANRSIELECGGKKMRTDIVLEAGLPVAVYYPVKPGELSTVLTSKAIGTVALKCYEKVMKGRVIVVPAVTQITI